MTRRDSVNSPEKVAARTAAATQGRRDASATLRRSTERQQPEWTEGQRVCIVGVGMDNLIHEHHTVTGMSKLYVFSMQKVKGGERERRHRLRDGHSPGGSSYGGTDIHATCQRPKK